MAVEIRVPRLGWSMEEGTFLGWLKQEGEAVKSGDVLYELEGEKATQEIESLDVGVLRIPANAPVPGSVVAVGALLGYLVSDGEAIPDTSPTRERGEADTNPTRERGRALHETTNPESRASNPESVTLNPERGGAPALADASGYMDRVIASPRARRVATELGVDWTRLKGSGRNGRVRERDVRAATATDGTRSTFSPRRRVIADRMLASQRQTASVTLTTRADATQLVRLREQFKASKTPTIVPSYADIIAKLAVTVLRQYPHMASRWDGDRLIEPTMTDDLAIGIAVDTDGGLLVPVIPQVSRLSVRQVAERSRELIEKARAGKLSTAEMQGGVFTITNLGAYGIDAFTPIINVPETAILGLGAIRREPVVIERDQIVIRDLITLSLTFDHRVTDGAPAARFLQTIRAAIEDAAVWLLN
ncbi:MAG: dihydrolipoamide acetyltransferase family protein [Planctomycetia bacterium]|nr:dihydrolipoamide acetyltransferase family protein [Planctomycetia bacterium]